MAIVNVTPDSFYAGSRTMSARDVARRVEEVVSQGASIVDVGGYSSRPGAAEVPPEEELRRVLLGVETVRNVAPDMIVSIDTFRASVAEEVMNRWGPCIVNDISAGHLDPGIVDIVAAYGVPYVAMHMRGTPADMQQRTSYRRDIVDEVCDWLCERVDFLASRGVSEVIVDPGFGFAKTVDQNYRLLAGMRRLKRTECPILAGVSRKSMIYKVLENVPEESFAGTSALHWECLSQGADILRVHDVQAAVDVVRLHEYYRAVGFQDGAECRTSRRKDEK